MTKILENKHMKKMVASKKDGGGWADTGLKTEPEDTSLLKAEAGQCIWDGPRRL